MSPPNLWHDKLGSIGSTFMTAPLIRSTSKELGMPSAALYFRGRVGVLGALTPEAAYDVLAIFPRRVIDAIWERSADVDAQAAADAYLDVAHRWGRDSLVDDGAAAEATTLLEKVLDDATLPPMLIAQGWQRAPRPDDVPARLAQAAMAVREIRGGLYFSALGLVGLSVPSAMIADPGAGPKRMGQLGWNEDEIDAVSARRRPSDAGRWRDAENALDGAFVGLLGDLLGEDGVTTLADALQAVRRSDAD